MQLGEIIILISHRINSNRFLQCRYNLKCQFRRTSATRAAEAGATSEQLIDFYGWKSSSVCKQYISLSKPAITGMAAKLAVSSKTVTNIKQEHNDALNSTDSSETKLLPHKEQDSEMYSIV